MNLTQLAQKATNTFFHSNTSTESSIAGNDPIELLKSQHKEVDELFKQIEDLSPKAYKSKQKIFETIAKKLELHTQIEEKVFYPATKQLDKDLILEAYEEHDVVKDLIEKIQACGPEDESFDAKICVLKEAVQHHVKEEENELFPETRSKFSTEKLMAIGEIMKKEQSKLEQHQDHKIHRHAKKKLKRA